MATLEKATFAAGCFWHVEAEFRKVKGVKDAISGYIGGSKKNPSYEDVCTDETGYAEAVEVMFDTKMVSYEQLLDVFWQLHDPTTLNRQGSDTGTQYRSAIFYHDEKQKNAAIKARENLEKSGRFKEKIVTQIVKAGDFFKAEEYHQRYYEKNRLFKCG